jgi:GSH-dependent disulfide-bond oxidoreductase
MAAVTDRPIDVHTWTTPNGWKIPIMLEECGIPYRIIPVNIGKNEQFSPDFLAISPNNKIPAIVDHDGPGGEPITVFESGAILQYLGRKTGKFYPSDERARVAVDEWLFWQVAGFGPMLGQTHHFKIYAQEKIPYAIERFTTEAKRLYGVLDRRLEGRDYIAGEYSIADIATLTWAKLNFKQGVDIATLPNVARWLERVLERPAVQRGLAAI